jgi:hypothetical protein
LPELTYRETIASVEPAPLTTPDRSPWRLVPLIERTALTVEMESFCCTHFVERSRAGGN